jgi:hypothetical protein
MEPVQFDPPSRSTCTSCTYSEDFSNYWTASLYFKSPENGTFQRVPQFANVGIQQDGGMTVYYMAYSAKNGKLTAFKPGFRMIAGDPMAKKPDRASLCHRCLKNGEGFAPCDSKDTAELPTKYCPGGIRATVIFPSCWNGKDLDSPDHKSHVAYSNGGGLGSPNCPSTHPVAIPQVMYEIMWDTGRYKNDKWYGNGKQPFVYSFGDGQVVSLWVSWMTLTRITVLVTANTATTFLAGRATLCRRLWMHFLREAAPMRTATCSRFSLPRTPWRARSSSKLLRMWVFLVTGLKSFQEVCP